MGKPAGRKGDIGSGHGKCSPTPITSGSGNVSINGKPAARVGDSLMRHCKHGRTIAEGSSSVFINGKPAARVGDGISCGGSVAIGSSNVFIGDSPVLMSSSNATPATLDNPEQQGQDSQTTSLEHFISTMAAHEKVTIDEPTGQTPIAPSEYKNAIVRIAIPAEHAPNDTFTLSATDGSYSATKTIQDDLIPGDAYIDLLFEQLDTSKLFRLEHTDARHGISKTFFDTYNYESIAGISGHRQEIPKELGVSPHKRIPK